MRRLSVEKVLDLIDNNETFSATTNDGAFSIIIEKYVPYVCAAIHNGNRIEDDFLGKYEISEFERWQEEDPFTGEFTESLPIRIIVNDSRYMYDLNRDENKAIYGTAWGKKVWKQPLSGEDRDLLMDKHKIFYAVVHKLIDKLEEKFKNVLVFDIHSYNYQRDDRKIDFPMINIGTERIDREKYGKYIDYYLRQLKKIDLGYIDNTVRENDIFFGRGYFLNYISTNFKNTLVLATEIKKVYVSEKTGETYPEVINQIKIGLKNTILNTSYFFIRNMMNNNTLKKYDLLSSKLSRRIIEIDRQIYRLFKNFEILQFVNPTNVESQKKQFFKSKFRKNPEFRYRPININAFNIKKELYKLAIEEIEDISLQKLYRDTIEDFSRKIDLLSSINTSDFKYNSLKIFGEPSDTDIKNAHYLLHINGEDGSKEKNLDTNTAIKLLREEIKRYGFNWKVEVGKNLTSRAVVNNTKRILKIRNGVSFSAGEVIALASHEIGVHALTATNANYAKLKIFKLGFPNNTKTQEGLAILGEYLSGNLDIERLHNLAYRTIAINMMLKDYEFNEVFDYFISEHNLPYNDAFYLVSRVFRSGGFTKDYIYLRGFKEIYAYYKKGIGLEKLFLGKTSIEYIPIIEELIARNIIENPSHIPKEYGLEADITDKINFIVENLK